MFGGDASIAGKVIGNVVVLMGNARVVSGAEINGDMVVVGGTLDEEDEVIIHGERVMLKHLNFSLAGFPFHLGRQFKLFEFLFIPVKFFISLVLSFLVVLFLQRPCHPKPRARVHRRVQELWARGSSWRSSGFSWSRF